MINYHLHQQLHSHVKEVGCVDTFKDLMVTGGSDLALCIFTRIEGKYQEVNRVNIFESYLYSVKINPFELGPYSIAVGCKDSHIFLLDAQGNPSLVLEGHSSAVASLSWLDRDTLVSGSWDGTANIWSVSQNKVITTLKGHSHAVCVLAIGSNNLIITGSQDGNLNFWEASTGKLLKKKEKAHGDIIREIALVPSVGVLTCSNDETVKLWAFDGTEILCNRGHTSFVFT
jgi:phospholipase A-2-activating protein